MLTRLLLIGAVLVQCLMAAPSSSDLQTSETKWKGPHGPPPPGLYNYRGLGLGGWGSLYGWGGGWPGVGRFGPGFYDDPLPPFSLGLFPGGVDPWGLGYSGFGPWIY